MSKEISDLDRIDAAIKKGHNLDQCLEELNSLSTWIDSLRAQLFSIHENPKSSQIKPNNPVPGWPASAVVKAEKAFEMHYLGFQGGLLKFFGYRVGKSGLDQSERRSILKYIYRGDLPLVESFAYMKSWGEPASPKRLKKLANLIIITRDYALKKSGKNSMIIATQHWEEDLKWMKKTFYDGHHSKRFLWPS